MLAATNVVAEPRSSERFGADKRGFLGGLWMVLALNDYELVPNLLACSSRFLASYFAALKKAVFLKPIILRSPISSKPTSLDFI